MIKRLSQFALVGATLLACGTYFQLPARADTATPIVEKTYRALLVPDDPTYPQWYTDKISAPQAWDVTTGSGDVIIAVVDTGFGLNHEDMVGRWAENAAEGGAGCTVACEIKRTNGLDDDGNGRIDDWRGWDFVQNDNDPVAGSVDPAGAGVSHGTITSGLVGATGNNTKGVASLNWGAKILPLQALNDEGEGYTSNVAAAIDYAVVRGAKVISLSLGSNEPDDFLRQRINAAINQGVVVVAAAGNSGCDCMVYPANYPEVVAVGATNSSDVRASFSSYGANLDVMAPGAGTIKAPFWSSTNQTTLYTSSINGTSISTPIVAGLVGLLKTQSPSSTTGEIIGFITDGADKVSGMGGLNRTDQYGYGRINARTSLSSYKWALFSVSHSSGTALMEAGQTQNITIRAKNTGSATWSRDGPVPVRLGTWQPERNSAVYHGSWFSPIRPALLQESLVAPQEIGTFVFTVRGPYSGEFLEKVNLVAEGQTWFNDVGAHFYLNVTADYRWQLVWQSLSTGNPNIGRNRTFNITIRAKNTGSTAWHKGGDFPVRLGTEDPKNRGSRLYYESWLRDIRPTGLVENVVPPGSEGTFTFTVRTPSNAGILNERFNLVAENIKWFNDTSLSIFINVL